MQHPTDSEQRLADLARELGRAEAIIRGLLGEHPERWRIQAEQWLEQAAE